MPLLHHLIETGNLAEFCDSLNRGLNPNVQDGNGNTPLHIAALKVWKKPEDIEVNLKFVHKLINCLTNVNQTNKCGNTPLHFAVARRKHKMIEVLLTANAQINVKDNYGNSELHYAINNCAMLKQIDTNYTCAGNHLCADWKTVKQLMKWCPDINATNNKGQTPLMWAVKAGNYQIVKKLTQSEAMQNQTDLRGNTALHFAFKQPELNLNIITELLRYGSSPSIANERYRSPLIIFLRKLRRISREEARKMEYVLKLILLKIVSLNEPQFALIRSYAHNHYYCPSEINRMHRHKVSLHYSVYDIVTWDYRTLKMLPSKVWDKLMDKALLGKYQFYSEVIASCFPRLYLSCKFAEVCRWVGKYDEKKEFLNYDLRFLLAHYYLSPFDTYNMIVAQHVDYRSF